MYRVLLNFSILFILLSIDNTCVKWRQTGGCNPSGPREEQKDQNCSVPIDKQWSGYCECKQYGKWPSLTFMKSCGEHTEGMTCDKACSDLFTAEKVEKTKWSSGRYLWRI